MRGMFVVSIIISALLFLLVLYAPASAEIYQWKDSSGNVMYGDSPPAGVKTEQKKYREDRVVRHEYKEKAVGKKDGPALREYGDIEVVMYMTSWCPYCEKARKYINSLGVRLTEYDIDKDKRKNDEMLGKSGQRGVPVIDVEGIVIKGFTPDGIKQAVESKRKT